MKFIAKVMLVLVFVLLPLVAAQAAPVAWTDWTSASPGIVDGSLTFGGDTVAVQFSGTYYFAQTSGGVNFWIPSTPYISATVPNAPRTLTSSPSGMAAWSPLVLPNP